MCGVGTPRNTSSYLNGVTPFLKVEGLHQIRLWSAVQCLILQTFQDGLFTCGILCLFRGNICASSVTDLSFAFIGINTDKSIKITGSETQMRVSGWLCHSLLPYHCQNLQMSCISVRTNSGHKERRVLPWNLSPYLWLPCHLQLLLLHCAVCLKENL